MESFYQVRPSPIHGMGIFATRKIRQGEILPFPKNHPDNCAGFNHSCQPNLSDRLYQETHHRQALRDIAKDEEMTAYYLNMCDCETCISQGTVVCHCPKHKEK